MVSTFKDLYKADRTLTTLMVDDKYRGSPGSAMAPRNAVIVCNATKEFDFKPLIWALENIVHSKFCTVTLLGIMPFLNIPLSIKVWTDIWTYPNKDLSALPKMNIKHLKLHAIMKICKRYEVVPHIKTRQGYPRHLIVVEEITKLHPTWVIFDRHHRKDREHYAAKIPFNMVIMRGNGYVDMIRGQSMIGDCSFGTPTESPATLMPSPKFLISKELQMDLRKKAALEKQQADKYEEFVYEI
uniref:Uncharacterized protein n=1 Tax=Kalanchoe fedtschenkoi TaxID=63787 RepID=A0A7N0UYL8_KALFE